MPVDFLNLALEGLPPVQGCHPIKARRFSFGARAMAIIGHAHFGSGVFISSSSSDMLVTLTNPLSWAHNLQQLT